jgi:anti-anti-sigma regulatory factor
MKIEINKSEQYTVINALESNVDDIASSQIEKAIAGLYSSEGRINYILDFSKSDSVDSKVINLLQKVQKICQKESGLLVVVNSNDALIENVLANSEEFILFLPSLEEAIDAVFMNELENDFKDEADDDFGVESENEY